MAKTLTLFLFPFLLFQLSSTATPPFNPAPSSTICNSTPYPTDCAAVAPANASSNNVYDYGRFSIRKSLTTAQKFLTLINNYLRQSNDLTITTIRALEDCKFLAQCNIDNLVSSAKTINEASRILPDGKADDIQTLLSAILTNAQTCIDGLQATTSAWSVRNGVLSPLSNDTRLYSVSLALFTKGWVPKKRRGPFKKGYSKRSHMRLRDGQLNIKMSNGNQAIYRTLNGRRLLQATNVSDQIQVNNVVIVSQDGTGNYTTISDAVNAVPKNMNGSTGYFLIYVKAGVYEEYVVIPTNKKYIMMIGEGINQTIITGNHNVVDGWTTFNSSSFVVTGTGFVGANITFRNTAGPAKHQAVAVRNGADLSTFYGCNFEGYQDTLYVHSLRQFYVECNVYGTVDFIFGNAAVVFQNCNLYPRLPMPGQFNAITAQGRSDPNQNTGISVHNCTVQATDELAGSSQTVQTYLGRPWKEYSRTVYMQSFLGSVISPAGWSAWSGDFALNTSYYAEYANQGPGSDTSQRVTWPGFHVINDTEAAGFTVGEFLLGQEWIPRTGAPYTAGLLS